MKIHATYPMFAVLLTATALQAGAVDPPPGVAITSEDPNYVHVAVYDLRTNDIPALTNIHALFTLYFRGDWATDEKMKMLAQLPFTNLACLVFTDCPLISDKGIEFISQIPTLRRLGLRQLSITDGACNIMTEKMRLRGVNMPNCTNVTVSGILKMAGSAQIEDLGFSVGEMTQTDLLRIVNGAGSKLSRMDIEMVSRAEQRLDLPALRQAGEKKKITLYAVRNKEVRRL